jgi:hypothetical protein
MYSAEDFVTRDVETTHLFLDPNNPRFWAENRQSVSDSRITEETIQARTEEDIASHGIDELYQNILENGFLPLDRIVVRQIGDSADYVVIEGNRRLAAIRRLKEDIERGEVASENHDDDYHQSLFKSLQSVSVVEYTGDETDIAWILQGIRHISGVRDWDPAQRGKLVATQIDEGGLGFKQAGDKFGLGAQAVGRLYRGYKALMQMKGHDEFGSAMRPEYFTLLEEAYRRPPIREWLEWNEEESRFAHEENLSFFYSWIVPEDGEQPARRIHDPGQLGYLAELLAADRNDLIERMDRRELSIQDAITQHRAENTEIEWRPALRRARNAIAKIPAEALVNDKEAVLEELQALTEKVEALKEMLQPSQG